MKAHRTSVSALAQRVSDFHASGTPFRIYHGSTLSTRKSSRNRDTIIDVSRLNRVIQFDKVKKVVLVEPNVPMDALVEATLAEGFLPKVVMELPNITAGGGFSGTSGESSSFKYGLFDSTISGIELILGNGDVVWASADNDHRDLFFAAAGSCGSLGVVTLLEMELIEAKSFVELEYVPVYSIEESVAVLRHYQQQDWVDYIDGILYSRDRGVIMVGRLSDDAIPGRTQRFDRASDPWCYLHAEEVLKSMEKQGGKEGYKESIPVQSYLFRYDRGVFWSGLRAFNYFLTPFNRLTRYLLDPFMYSRTMVHALHRSGLASQAIIQDYAVPYDSTRAFIEWTDEKTGLWPLWLCPVKSAAQEQRSFSQGNNVIEDVLLDVGIWGMGPKDSHEFIKLNRDFEAKVRELRGMKCLYAHAYYTEEEFWEIYDEKRYKELRRKYQAESLPSVYEKVRVDLQGVVGKKGVTGSEGWSEWMRRQIWGIWPLGGLYGVASATKGFLVQSDFLLKK